MPDPHDDEFDPRMPDDAELEEIVMAGEDLDEPRSFAPEDADLGEDEGVEALGDGAAPRGGRSRRAAEDALDRALQQTFPASDPMSINPGAD